MDKTSASSNRCSLKVRSVRGFCHRWPTAPDHLAYLRNAHQHEFVFDVKVSVVELDRERSFEDVRTLIDSAVDAMIRSGADEMSCETMAKFVLDKFKEWQIPVLSVGVYEDRAMWQGAEIEVA